MAIYPKFDIDAANLASKLPEPLRKPAGSLIEFLLQATGAEDPANIMPGPVATIPYAGPGKIGSRVVGISRAELDRLLAKTGKDRIEASGSELLKAARMPHKQGSADPARIISHMPIGMWNEMESTPKPDMSTAALRDAAKKLKTMSQDILGELGVNAKDKIRLWRGGGLMEKPWTPAPTSIDPQRAAGYNWEIGLPSKKGVERFYDHGLPEYGVPRDDVQGVVGLLRGGDALTRSEILVPSGILEQNNIRNFPSYARSKPWQLAMESAPKSYSFETMQRILEGFRGK